MYRIWVYFIHLQKSEHMNNWSKFFYMANILRQFNIYSCSHWMIFILCMCILMTGFLLKHFSEIFYEKIFSFSKYLQNYNWIHGICKQAEWLRTDYFLDFILFIQNMRSALYNFCASIYKCGCLTPICAQILFKIIPGNGIFPKSSGIACSKWMSPLWIEEVLWNTVSQCPLSKHVPCFLEASSMEE